MGLAKSRSPILFPVHSAHHMFCCTFYYTVHLIVSKILFLRNVHVTRQNGLGWSRFIVLVPAPLAQQVFYCSFYFTVHCISSNVLLLVHSYVTVCHDLGFQFYFQRLWHIKCFAVLFSLLFFLFSQICHLDTQPCNQTQKGMAWSRSHF